jgi:hypothetical protein
MSYSGLDAAERFRRRLWYFNVRSRSGMSDYQLSRTFDLYASAVSKRVAGKARRRIFERLRKFDEMPFRGHTAEFVRMVDQYPEGTALRGTERLYFSPFWDLIGKKPLDLRSLRSVILKSARNTGLLHEWGELNDQVEIVRSITSLNPDDILDFLASHEDHYDQALSSILPKCDLSLDLLALLGGLYREAYFAGHLRIALLLEGYLGNALQDVMDCDWVPSEIRDDLFACVVERVITLSVPATPIKTGYLSELNPTENRGSPLAMLLARHDRYLWQVIEDDPFDMK